jgi:hypothetical protein
MPSGRTKFKKIIPKIIPDQSYPTALRPPSARSRPFLRRQFLGSWLAAMAAKLLSGIVVIALGLELFLARDNAHCLPGVADDVG